MYILYYQYEKKFKYSKILNYRPCQQLLDKLIDTDDELFSITLLKLY